MAEKYNNENYTMYNEIEKTGKQTLVNPQTDIVFKGIFLKSKRALANLISSVIGRKDKARDIYNCGFEDGFKDGFEDGVEEGFKDGIEKGIENVTEQGVIASYDEGLGIDLITRIFNTDIDKVKRVIDNYDNYKD
jgi:flagellar biosynthesis/type III secretory pathway protein FliH